MCQLTDLIASKYVLLGLVATPASSAKLDVRQTKPSTTYFGT